MKILVAGGAGFIGSVLVPMLQAEGHELRVVDLQWFGNHLPAGTDLVRRQLFDLSEKDLVGFDQVIFLAGLSNDPMAEFSPAKNFIENGALPSYLAYQAKNAGVRRFIYASSCSVYGFSSERLCDEESEVTCGYPYGISKLQGERGVLQLEGEGFSTIALRQGTVCGYSPRVRFDLILNTMYKTARRTGEIVVNNASIWRPIIDVRDTAAAFLAAAEADPQVSGVFNVAYDNFTVGEAGELVKAAVEDLGSGPIQLKIRRVEDYRSYKVSCAKARRVLGFDPQHSVADIVGSLFEHEAEYGDFSKEAFYNIDTFKLLEGAQ
jgi:nucleoside-diphosphate-sugar epimerase